MSTATPINAYPELPVMPYLKTMIDMPTVIFHINNLQLPLEVKRTTYVIFRTESGNGQHGVQQDYTGIQADGARLPAPFDKSVIGTCVEEENGTGKMRRFTCFKDYTTSVDYLASRVNKMGLYIGGKVDNLYVEMAINNSTDLTLGYYRTWVTGSAKAIPAPSYYSLIGSIYHNATQLIVEQTTTKA
jgi:hypothetical protein